MITIYWGKEGFSVRILENERLTTIFDCYPNYFSLISENMAGRFENSKNGYLEYINDIKQNNILSYLYLQKKVYITYDKIDANALGDAFQATNKFIHFILKR